MRTLARNILLSLIFGILAGEYLHPNLILLFIILSLILLIPFRFYALYFILSSLFSINYKLNLPNLPKELYYQEMKVKGVIENLIEGERKGYLLKLNSLKIGDDEIRIKGKGRLFLREGISTPNDFVEIKGSLQPFNYPSNPNLFDWNQYWRRQGFVGNILVKEVKIIKRGKIPIIKRAIISFREYCSKTIERYFKGDEKALLFGLLFGETRGIPKAIKEDFSNAGVYHILAVSGLHIGILAFVLLIFLSILRIKEIPRIFIITFSLLFYLAAVGFSPSATRATIMFLLVSYSYILQRKTDPLHSLIIAAILILFFSPVSLFEQGFQLSFIITCFLLIFSERIYSFFKNRQLPGFLNKYLFLPLSVSISSFLGAFPLTWFYFYRIPIISPLANLFIVPLVSFALPLILLILTVNLLFPPLAHFLSNSLWLSLRLILELGKFLASQPFSTLNLAKPPVGLILLIYLLFFLTLRFQERPIRRLSVFLLLGGIAFFLWEKIMKREEVRITFLDTYRSEPIVIENRGKGFLILSGSWEASLEDFLLSRGISELEILFLPKRKEWDLRNITKKLRIKNIIIAKEDTIAYHYIGEGNWQMRKVDKDYKITYPEIEFHLFPAAKSYNLLLRVARYNILFYFGRFSFGQGEPFIDIMKVGGSLRRRRIEEVIASHSAKYFILQRRKYTNFLERKGLLNTGLVGAIEIKIKKEARIYSKRYGLIGFLESSK